MKSSKLALQHFVMAHFGPEEVEMNEFDVCAFWKWRVQYWHFRILWWPVKELNMKMFRRRHMKCWVCMLTTFMSSELASNPPPNLYVGAGLLVSGSLVRYTANLNLKRERNATVWLIVFVLLIKQSDSSSAPNLGWWFAVYGVTQGSSTKAFFCRRWKRFDFHAKELSLRHGRKVLSTPMHAMLVAQGCENNLSVGFSLAIE